MEAKFSPVLERSQPSANKGSYSQVGFSYDKDGKDEPSLLDSDEDDDDEEDDDDKDFSSNESSDEEMDSIAKEFGVKRFSWLVYMDKKAKEEERRQKEIIKGDPGVRKLSRKERRKASQMERGRERDFALAAGKRVLHPDPYRETRRSPTYESYSRSQRSRSRSHSYSPGYNRRHDRVENGHRNKSRTSKIEYITEFGGDRVLDDRKLDGISPPLSPQFEADIMSRPSTSCILEALHMDPASAVSTNQEKNAKALKPSVNIKSASAKLSKATDGSLTSQQTEKKETPQERLKRIMSKQLNKQIKKDSAAEMAKKREQERQRQEKLVEMSRLTRYRRRSHSRSVSRSPRRRYRHSRSRSPRRSYSRSKSPRRYRRSRSRSQTTSKSPQRYKSRSPRDRSRSRY